MAATAQQVIAGLYAAFFNRAPDAEGLSYWEGQATGGNDLSVFNTLAAGFATHYKFTDIYSGMSNQEFVEAIYVNALGYEGDSSGISYWTNLISGDMVRSDMVASFVHSALNIDLSDSQWDSLSASERDGAQNRQDTLANKAEVGIYFSETLGSGSNITNPNDLDNDTAYQRSISALADVDNTSDSVTTGLGFVNEISASLPSDSSSLSDLAGYYELLDAFVTRDTGLVESLFSADPNWNAVDGETGYMTINADGSTSSHFDVWGGVDISSQISGITANTFTEYTEFNATYSTTVTADYNFDGDILTVEYPFDSVVEYAETNVWTLIG